MTRIIIMGVLHIEKNYIYMERKKNRSVKQLRILRDENAIVIIWYHQNVWPNRVNWRSYNTN